MKKVAIPTTLSRNSNVAERGLKQDRGDQSRSINCRDRMFGFTLENEFLQHIPYFWTRDGVSCTGLQGMYRGGVAFLIAGGPSFKDVDKSKLKYCWTMALNNSPKTYRPDAWVCVDDPSRFLRSIWLDAKIMKFVPYGATEKKLWDTLNSCPLGWQVGDCPNIYYFKRNSKFHAERWMFESTLNWGNHEDYGGGRSVMLPALRILFILGFRTVYLLGVDFDMDKDSTYHFDEERTKSAVNCNRNTYKRMNDEYFPQLRPQFEKFGFKVFNCNVSSKLTAFDHVPFDKAVEHAMQLVGDPDKEQTRGMYEDPELKFKRYEEEMKQKAEKA